jgi:SAM-dependent methyltransferase
MSSTSQSDSLRHTIGEHGAAGWQLLYEQNVKPWDKGRVAPALANLISTEILPDGLAIVPGCGFGYDIAALATDKRHVIGVDIAEAAVEQAQANIAGTANTEILLADFFTLDYDGKVDLLYDYTFLCALPPIMRTQWADKISNLLKPGAILITMMFPLDVHEGGPPFTLSPEIYKDLLLPRGFELTRIDEEIESFPARAGNEKLGLWKRI